MPTFKILSFDGGGSRGALSTRLLKRIIDVYPNLLDEVDMIAGTSTGSLIALALAYGKSATFVDDFYSFENIKYIFTPSYSNLLRPKYNNIHLQTLLEEIFSKSLTLGHLNKYVFVPAFYLKDLKGEGYQAVFFNNLVNNPTIKETVINVALSSSAAPTFFPSHNGFIDGGVIANSPTAASVLYTKSLFDSTYTFSDFRLLSIGTGSYPTSIQKSTKRWGKVQWSFNPFVDPHTALLSLLLTDPAQLEIEYCKQLLKLNFFRLNPVLPHPIELDDYKSIPELKQIADETDLNATLRYIKNFFYA